MSILTEISSVQVGFMSRVSLSNFKSDSGRVLMSGSNRILMSGQTFLTLHVSSMG